jgi:hypothetical protein
MPPTTRVRPPVIPGAVLRRYAVATIEDVDSHLVDLRRWLYAAIERAPEFGMSYTLRYNTDRDRLLDARGLLMGLRRTA